MRRSAGARTCICRYYRSEQGGGSHDFPLEVLHDGDLLAFISWLFLHVVPFRWAWRCSGGLGLEKRTVRLVLGLIFRDGCRRFGGLTSLISWSPTYRVLIGLPFGVTNGGQRKFYPQCELVTTL